MSHAIFNSAIVVKSYKPKSSWPTRFFIHHQSCVKHRSELLKVFLEFLFNDILTDSADEDFRRLVLFIARNCSFRIDL